VAVPSELLRYLPTFLLAAEELSFSAAARRLGLTPAAVSKSVRTLEQGLGLRLFQRTTHALTLTDDGERLRRRLSPLLDALGESLATVRSQTETARGVLRVAAPYGMGKHRVLPLLPEFRRKHPEVELDLRFEDQPIDLVKEGVDVALGVRLDPRPGLIAKKLFDTRTALVASPKFLREHGVPKRPSDLERFACLRYRMPATGRLFPWMFTDPETNSTFTVNPPAAITASNLETIAELAADHHGIGLTGLTSAWPHLHDGAVVEVLRRYARELPPVTLYYTSKHDLPSRVRVFIEFLSEHLTEATVAATTAKRKRRK